jgi:hypothetical protein
LLSFLLPIAYCLLLIVYNIIFHFFHPCPFYPYPTGKILYK